LFNEILKVALPIASDKLFDYSNCDNKNINPVGHRVLVPFRDKKIIGIVVDTAKKSKYILKPVYNFIDKEPFFDGKTLMLAKWANDYYAYFYGMTLNQIMPSFFRAGKKNDDLYQKIYKTIPNITPLPKRAKKTAKILLKIAEHKQGITHNKITQKYPNCHSIIKKLIQNKYISCNFSLPKIDVTAKFDTAKKLNAQQQNIFDNIKNDLDNFAVHLIDGVTGSGKTEVYLQLINLALKRKKQILILVPEIGLTPQLITRFSKRFKTTIVAIHSGLNQTSRAVAYLQIKQNRAKIIIGTRSAIWCQFYKLGMIIVDEEHDLSFKQQSKFLYNTRDIAIVLAKKQNIPVLLGSATISCESYFNCKLGKYKYYKLTKRATNSKQPKVVISSILNLKLYEGISYDNLIKICNVIRGGNQVMLYINRRGFAPKYMCFECGFVKPCRFCSTTMTYHKSASHLRCHFCNYVEKINPICDNCGGGNLGQIGAGSEKIDELVNNLYPAYAAVRIDRDTTKNKGQLENKLSTINKQECQIIIGTQMLAKGHHFKNLKQVIILDADRGLFGTDFRSMEHMSCEILQVAGRAGRAGEQGEVIIQTNQPKNQFWQQLFSMPYVKVLDTYLATRKKHALPPFTRLILIRSKSKKQTFAEDFLQILKDNIPYNFMKFLTILGPALAPIEKIANMYRFNLVLFAPRYKNLFELKKWLLNYMQKNKFSQRLSWSIDVDSMDSS
jgi:primosomal protein N' (replication factor Y) (superfamily II helicase)